jgi:uncharacterized integral membrane protein
MGETSYYQPLTQEDKITVVLYRAGIVLSTLVICISAFLVYAVSYGTALSDYPLITSGLGLNILLLSLYLSVGLSVFFIHLYVGKFHRILKKIYYVAVACLAALFMLGSGNPVIPLLRVSPYAALLLIPVALCLGFIAAKEAFCFRLVEGYVLAFIMPAYTFFYAIGLSTRRGNVIAIAVVALLLLIFTARKVFQPIYYDIGDKSAYQP